MEQKKYILTDETIEVEGHTLHRIEYNYHPNLECADFTKGAKGGFIESEKNLSQEGACWVEGDAMVFGDAVVSDNAQVTDHAVVSDDARVIAHAVVGGYAKIHGKAIVYGRARIDMYAEVYENATVNGSSLIGTAARIHGRAQVRGNVIVNGHVDIGGCAIIDEHAHLYGHVKVAGSVFLDDSAHINGDAIIESERDYLTFKNHFSSGRFFVWTRSNNRWSVGCFNGTDEELIAKAMRDSPEKAAYYQVYVDTKNRLVALDEKFNKEKQQPE